MTQSLPIRMSRLKVLGKSPVNAILRLNRWLWSRMPGSLINLRLMHSYGTLLNTLARLGERRQFFGTYFLRNRPELELICRPANCKDKGSI